MRKLALFSFYFLLFGLLHAQVYLSLDMGYGNKGYGYSEQGVPAYDGSLPKGQSCYIAPEVGYAFNDYVAMGLQLGMDYSAFNYAEGFYDPIEATWQRSATLNSRILTAVARGYLRLCCFTTGNWSLHAEIACSYSMGWGWDTRNEIRALNDTEMRMKRDRTDRSFGVEVVPVASYAISHHVGVDFYLNLASLNFISTTTTLWPYNVGGMAASKKPESETTTQDFNVGINTLNTNLLTIGFYYMF